MIVIFLLFIFSILPISAHAAITYDTFAVGEGTASTSHSHTVAADADIVIVGLCIREVTPDVQPATGVTVGGVAATFLAGIKTTDNIVRAEFWYKLAPATGAVTITSTGAVGTDRMVAGSMSFKGVAQTSTFNTAGTAQSTGSTNANVDALASAVGELGVMVGCVRTFSSTPSADATAPVSTERYEEAHNDAISIIGFGYTEDGAATSINMRVDLSGSERWAAAAASMRPAASGRRPISPMLIQ